MGVLALTGFLVVLLACNTGTTELDGDCDASLPRRRSWAARTLNKSDLSWFLLTRTDLTVTWTASGAKGEGKEQRERSASRQECKTVCRWDDTGDAEYLLREIQRWSAPEEQSSEP